MDVHIQDLAQGQETEIPKHLNLDANLILSSKLSQRCGAGTKLCSHSGVSEAMTFK